MSRHLCVYFPFWSTCLAKKLKRKAGVAEAQLEHPLLLVAQESQQIVVRRFCEKAAAAGVKEGMAVALAKALLDDAQVAEYNPRLDFRFLYQLAVWGLKFSPYVGLDADLLAQAKQETFSAIAPSQCGLILDITGTERVHKGELALAARVLTALRKAGFMARIGLASTIGAAWALSRYGEEEIQNVSATALESALSALPIHALRLSPSIVTTLTAVGVTTIGALLKLPRETLPARFGDELLLRIDQAMGTRPEPMTAIQAPFVFKVQRAFEVPLTQHQAIEEAILQLLKALFAQLQKRSQKAAVFLLVLYYVRSDYGRGTIRKEIALHSASKNFLHIKSVVQPVVQALQIPGGVERILLFARDTARQNSEQRDIFGSEYAAIAEEVASEFLNSLVVRLGSERVQRVRFQHSHIPEHNFSYYSVRDTPQLSNAVIQSGYQPGERPSYILQRPIPLQVIAMLPDKPPAWIKWHDRTFRVVKGVGPERIAPEWWHTELAKQGAAEQERDYFKVQDDRGRWLWLYRTSCDAQWYLHGIWG